MKRFTLGLLALLFSFSVQAAPTVNIIPHQASYQVGDTVLLSVSLSDSPPIHGGGLNVRFNPKVLQAQSVVISNVWSFANRPGVINNIGGSITDILFASFNTVEGELDVAIIQLAVVGNGSAGFFVTESTKNPFSDANGQAVSFNINNLFRFNTTVVEPETEETSDQTTTQTTEENLDQTTTQATEEKSEPDTTQATEEKSEPDTTQAAEEKSEPDTTQATEEKSEPDTTQATEEKSEPDTTQATEEKSEPDTTQTTEEKSELDTTQTTKETSEQTTSQPDTQETAQTTTQNTSTDGATTTTESSNNGDTGFSNTAGFVSLPNTTASKKQLADNSQNDRQFFLPSGPGAIPINVTDDNKVEEQADTAMNSETTASLNKTVDQHAQETIAAKKVGASLSASETTISGRQNAQTVSEIQPFVDAGNMESDDPINYLTYVLIFAAVFVLFITYQVFYKNEY